MTTPMSLQGERNRRLNCSLLISSPVDWKYSKILSKEKCEN